MKKFIDRLCVTAMLSPVFFGCTAQTIPPAPKGTQYVSPNEVIAGSPATPTMYDLETSAQMLMEKMRAHPQFVKNYDTAKAAKNGKLPIVCLGLPENKTSQDEVAGDVRPKLRALNDTIRVALFDSALFEIKDDEAVDAIKSRIVRSTDGGIENAGELVKTFGEQDTPDFIVLSDFRHVSDIGGYHTYRLRIALHNLKTGKLVWEGIQTKVKL